VISAAGALAPLANQPAGTANFTGRNISITTTSGSVGTAADPLVLSANGSVLPDGSVQDGIINVSALNDIGIVQQDGALRVGSIASSGGGNVFLSAPRGRIVDASGETPADALSSAQRQQVWQDLHLTDALGASASAQSTVTAFENLVDSKYQQYWQLLGYGSVSHGAFTLNASDVPIYQAQAAAALNVTTATDAQVQAFTSSLYQSLVAFFVNNLGANWAAAADFQKFNPTFKYTATSDQVTQLTQNSVWTAAELSYMVDASALSASSGTPVGVATPNVSGRDVTLDANGGIGRLAPPVFISLADLQAGTLTTDQSSALALATTPGDVLMVGTDAHGKTVTFPFGEQPDGVTLTGIQVKQLAPLFVAVTGSLSTHAGGVAFIQSTTPTLTLNHVAAGGDVSITAPQDILASTSSTLHIVTPGNLTLLAGTGQLGDGPDAPLDIQVGGELLSASAGTDLSLDQTKGDLLIGVVFAKGTTTLTSTGSIFNGGGTNAPIAGTSVTITSNSGGIGTISSPIAVTEGTDGKLSVDAKGDVFMTGAVKLDSVVSHTGDVTFAVTQGDALVVDVKAPQGTANISAPGSILDANASGGVDIKAESVALSAQTGTVGAPSDPFRIETTGTTFATAPGSINIVAVQGDMRLLNVTSARSDVTLTSAGAILDGNATGGDNIDAVNIVLNAQGGAVDPLKLVSTGTVSIQAQGAIDVAQTQGDMHLINATSLTSDVTLAAAGSIVDSNAMGGDNVDGSNISLTAQGGTLGTTTDALRLNDSGTTSANAQGAVFLTQVHGDMRLLNVTSTSDSVTLIAPGSILDANNASSDDLDAVNVFLTAQAGSLGKSQDPIRMTATGTFAGSATGDIALTQTHGDLKVLGATSTGGDVRLSSSGSILDAGTGSTSVIDAANVDLSALAGSIGTASSRLFVNVAFSGPGALVASAATGIFLTQTTGGLTIDGASTTAGPVIITVPASLGLGIALTVDATATVSGPAGVTLQSGNDIILEAGSVVTSTTAVALIGDLGNTQPGPGSTISVDSAINAPLVTITGTKPDDTLNLQDAAAGSVVNVDLGGGRNFINLGGGPLGLGGIQGVVNITGHFSDTLGIDDSGDTAPQTGTLTASGLSGLNMGKGQIHFSGITGLTILLGSGGNHFTIASTPTGQTTLESGAGDDTVMIQTIAGPTLVEGQGGNDTILVGSAQPKTQGTLAGIAAALAIDGGTGTNTIQVDDTGSPVSEAGILSATSLTGLNMKGVISYANASTLGIHLGASGNLFRVDQTNGATATSIDAAGASTFTILDTAGPLTVTANAVPSVFHVGSAAANDGGLLGQIQGPLTLHGSGADLLTMDDSGEVAPLNSQFSATALTGAGMGARGIAYDGMGSVNLALGTGAGTLAVAGTIAGTTEIHAGGSIVNLQAITGPTTIDAPTAAETINVGSSAPATGGSLAGIAGALSLTGGAYPVSVVLDDTGDQSAGTNYLTSTLLAGLDMPGTIFFAQSGSLSLDLKLGSAPGTFTISNTPAGQTRIEAGPGETTINIQGTSGPLVLALGTGSNDITISSSALNHEGTVAAIQGPVSIDNTSGSAFLTVDDSGDTAPVSATLTADRLTGLGMPYGIAYQHLTSVAVDLGTAADQFTVDGTSAPATTIESSGTGDAFAIHSTGGPLSINTAGPASFVVADHPGTTGPLASQFSGPIVLDPALGASTLEINDATDPTDRSISMNSDAIVGLGFQLRYQNIANFDLTLGRGNDGIAISSLTPNTNSVVIDGSAGTNTLSASLAARSTTAITLRNIREITSFNVDGDFGGSLLLAPGNAGATNANVGRIDALTIRGDLTIPGSIQAPAIQSASIRGNLDGTISETSATPAGSLSIGGAIASTGDVSWVGGLQTATIGGDIVGRFADYSRIVDMTVGGSVMPGGSITAGSIHDLAIAHLLSGTLSVPGGVDDLSVGGKTAPSTGSTQSSPPPSAVSVSPAPATIPSPIPSVVTTAPPQSPRFSVIHSHKRVHAIPQHRLLPAHRATSSGRPLPHHPSGPHPLNHRVHRPGR
jgi:hypothetical protein